MRTRCIHWAGQVTVGLALLAVTAALQAQATVAEVTFDAGGLIVTPRLPAGHTRLLVRVANERGEIVGRLESRGEPLRWVVPADARLGLYRYEILALPSRAAADGRKLTSRAAVPLRKVSGGFLLERTGLRALPGPVTDAESKRPTASNTGRSTGVFLPGLVHALLAAIAGPAQAQDLTAAGPAPAVIFNDTDRIDQDQWVILADEDLDPASWWLEHNLPGDTHVPLQIYSNGESHRAITVWPDGDVQFGEGTIVADGTNSMLGIGTGFPEWGLHLFSDRPQQTFEEIGVGSGAIQYFGNIWGFFIDDDTDGIFSQVLGFSGEPPQPSGIVVKPGGDGISDGMFGIGHPDPSHKLHVTGIDSASGKDNTSAMLLENTAGQTANRVMIRVANNGNSQMLWENTATGDNWQVNPIGKSFVFSLGKTGTQEARITGTGGLVLAGALTENSDRDSKTDIRPVDSRSALNAVRSLPISTWQYRRDEAGTRHLGPMAQDFHAAFGLGASEAGISTLDTSGVALAAIQGLSAELEEEKAANRALRARLAAQEARLSRLEARLGL